MMGDKDNWDHRMLIWEHDPILDGLQAIDPSVVAVPFNPTAENIAAHLVTKVGPDLLAGTSVRLVRVQVDETSKCRASYHA
jgi:6-pyruvoyltetrahydropterin/6-carboxytetrahydropterin synthase